MSLVNKSRISMIAVFFLGAGFYALADEKPVEFSPEQQARIDAERKELVKRLDDLRLDYQQNLKKVNLQFDGEKSALQAELGELEKRYKEQESNLSLLLKEREDLSQRLTRLQAVLARLRELSGKGKGADQEKMVVELKQKLATAIADCSRQRKECENELKQRDQTIAAVRSENDQWRGELSKTKDKLTALIARSKDWEKERKDFEVSFQKNADLKKQMTSIKTRLENAKSARRKLESDLLAARDAVALARKDRTNEVAVFADRLEGHAAALEKLATEKAALTKSTANCMKRLAQAGRELATAKGALQEEQSKVVRLEENYRQSQTQLAALHKAADKATVDRETLKKLQEQFRIAQASLKAAREAEQEAGTRMAAVTRERDSAKTEAVALVDKSNKLKIELETKLAATTRERDTLRKAAEVRVAESDRELQRLKVQLKTALTSSDALEGKLRISVNERADAKKRYESASAQLKALQAEQVEAGKNSEQQTAALIKAKQESQAATRSAADSAVKLKQVEAQLADSVTDLKMLKTQFQTLDSERSGAVRQLELVVGKFNAIQAEQADSGVELQEKKAALAAARKETETARNSAANSAAKAKEVEERFKDALVKIKQLEGNLGIADGERSAAQRDVESLTAKLNALAVKQVESEDRLKKDKSTLRASLEASKREADAERKSASENAAKLKLAEMQLKDATTQARQLEIRIETLDAERVNALREMEALKAGLNSITAKQAVVEKSNKDKESAQHAALKASKEEAATAKKTAADSVARLRDALTKIDQLEKQLLTLEAGRTEALREVELVTGKFNTLAARQAEAGKALREIEAAHVANLDQTMKEKESAQKSAAESSAKLKDTESRLQDALVSVTQLNGKLQALETERTEALRQVETANSKLNALTSKQADSSKTLKNKETAHVAALAASRKEIEVAQKSAAANAAKLKDAENKLQDALVSIVQFKDRLQKLESDRSEALRQVELANNKLNALSVRQADSAKALKNKEAAHVTALAASKKDIEAARESVTESSTKLKDTESKLQDALVNVGQLNGRLQKLESERTEALRQVESANGKLNVLSARQADSSKTLKNKETTHAAALEASKKEIEAAQKSAAENATKLKDNQDRLQDSLVSVKQLEGNLLNLEAARAEALREVESLTNKLNALSAKQAETGKVTAEVLRQQTIDLDSAKNAAVKAAAAAEEARKELNDLVQKLEDSRTLITQLETRVRLMEEEKNQAVTRVEAITSQLNATRATGGGWKDRAAAAEEKLAVIEKQLADAEKKAVGFRVKLEDSESARETAEAQLKQLRQRLVQALERQKALDEEGRQRLRQLEKTRTELQTRAGSAESSLVSVRAQLQEASDTISTMKKANLQLGNQLELGRKLTSKLKIDHSSELDKNRDELTAELQKSEARLLELRHKLAASGRTREKLAADLQSVRNAKDQLEAKAAEDRTAGQRRWGAQQQALQEVLAKKVALEKEAAHNRALYDEANRLLGQKASNGTALQEEIAASLKRETELRNHIAGLQEQKETADQEKAELSEKLANLTSERDEDAKERKNLENKLREITVNQEAQAKLVVDLKKQLAEYAQFKTKATALEVARATLETRLTDTQGIVSRLQTQSKSAETDLTAALGASRKLEADLLKLQNEKKKAEEELRATIGTQEQAFKTQLDESLNAFAALQKEAAKDREILGVLGEEKTQLDEKLNVIQAELTRAKEAHDIAFADLKADAAIAEKALADQGEKFSLQLKERDDMLARKESDLNGRDKLILQLKAQLDNAGKDLAAANKLKTDFSKTTNELATLRSDFASKLAEAKNATVANRDLEAKIAQLQEGEKKIRADLQEALNKVTEHSDARKAQDAEIAKLRQQVADGSRIGDENLKLKDRLAKLESDQAKWVKLESQWQIQQTDFTTRLGALNTEKGVHEEALKKALAENGELMKQLEALSAQLSSKGGDFDKLQAELNKLRGLVEAANGENKSLVTTRDQLTSDKKKLEELVAELERRLRSMQGVAERYRERLYEIDPIYYVLNESNISAEQARVLGQVRRIVADYPDAKFEITGHTCDIGSDEANLTLSQRRADSLRDYLIKNGLNADNLTSTGYGETRPAAENTSEENRQKNRRVEIGVVGSGPKVN